SERLEGLNELPEDIQAFSRKCLALMLTQFDSQGGILAANDSDIMIDNRSNYSYVWPRDGALVAAVLDDLGDTAAADRYADFCLRLPSLGRPYLLQKYRSDATFGSTWHPWFRNGREEIPLQEDETALTVWFLARRASLPKEVFD